MLDVSELYDALGGDQRMPGGFGALREEPGFEMPAVMTDLEMWANFVNDDLYEMDKKLRLYFKKTRYARSKGNFKVTASLVFAALFGRKPEPSDGQVCRMLHTLLKYYCTSYTGATTFMGQRVTRVYKFSKFSTNSKRPYSLRLRLEEMNDGKHHWKSLTANGPGVGKSKLERPRCRHREGGDDADGGRGDVVGGEPADDRLAEGQ